MGKNKEAALSFSPMAVTMKGFSWEASKMVQGLCIVKIRRNLKKVHGKMEYLKPP